MTDLSSQRDGKTIVNVEVYVINLQCVKNELVSPRSQRTRIFQNRRN